jgi:hypothetical protein
LIYPPNLIIFIASEVRESTSTSWFYYNLKTCGR